MRSGHHRFRHRDAAHAQAHARQDDARPALDHPLVASGAAVLIEAQAQLLAAVSELRAAGSFAFDSEFIGETSYYPRLCLLQAATTRSIFLIDPLADLDLQPLWELICDPAVLKIVHAGEQDLEPAARALGRSPANVLDTQIAAGFARLSYPCSLSRLLQELLGLKLGKGMTFSHWDHRPLSRQQLAYAADDVRYLPALADLLRKRLTETGTAEAAAEECASLCDASLYVFDVDAVVRRIRGSNLPPRNQAVLRALLRWRDQAARRADLPPRSFLRDEVVMDMARDPVKQVAALAKVKGLPRPLREEAGAELVKLMTEAAAADVSEEPTPAGDEGPHRQFRLDALVSTAATLACAAGIDAGLFASRAALSDLLRALDRGEDVSDSELMTGWRGQLIGRRLLELFRGQRAVEVRWHGGVPSAST